MTTIPISDSTQRFMQGVAAGNKVNEAHGDLPFPDLETRLALYWFYVGALAAGEYKCTETEHFEPFIMGAKTRAPQDDTED